MLFSDTMAKWKSNENRTDTAIFLKNRYRIKNPPPIHDWRIRFLCSGTIAQLW